MNSIASYKYEGTELGLFANAHNWKQYWSSLIAPYLRGDVLDVGAGLGATIMLLGRNRTCNWTALEPDPDLAKSLEVSLARNEIPDGTRIIRGSTLNLSADERFDAILYIDVLEHIEDDAAELSRAMSMLRTGGHLIVLVPAHQWLYSPFDAAVGHWRRYSAKALARVMPEGMRRIRLSYLDSMGMLTSLGNRILLRSAAPTTWQIALWDSKLVPCSRLLDRFFLGFLGKSLLLVARKES